MIILSLEPKIKILIKNPKPSNVKNGTIPIIKFINGANPDNKENTEIMFAVSWGKIINLFSM